MDKATSEEWRPVADSEGLYEISNLGRVKSFAKGAPRILKGDVTSRGYARVNLGKDDRRFIHLLVAEAFLGPRPEGMQCYFLDGNPARYGVDNLAWGEPREKYYTKGGLTCSVCGAPLRHDNATGICSGSAATTDCKRERKNLERIAMGLPPLKPAEDRRAPGELTEVHAGDTFGLWTVLEDGRGVVNYVSCRCACGTERNVTIARLTEGRSTSCGTECPARRAANPYLRAGEVYGRLTVLEDALRSRDLILCRCECGNETRKNAGLVKNGHTASCRCRMGKFTHGLSRHPLWGTWDGIRDRCNNPASNGYDRYGACGVTLCAGWTGTPDGFLSFIADMGERPEGMTVDRIDVEGGYWCGHCEECIRLGRPANCQWATATQQARNKRSVGKLAQQRNAALAKAEAALAEVERLNLLLASATAPRKRGKPMPGAEKGTLF